MRGRNFSLTKKAQYGIISSSKEANTRTPKDWPSPKERSFFFDKVVKTPRKALFDVLLFPYSGSRVPSCFGLASPREAGRRNHFAAAFVRKTKEAFCLFRTVKSVVFSQRPLLRPETTRVKALDPNLIIGAAALPLPLYDRVRLQADGTPDGCGACPFRQ